MAHTLKIGLSSEEAKLRLASNGPNKSSAKQQPVWWQIMKDVVTEPVFIMLLIASSIYFFTGSVSEGSTMLVALLLVAGIAAYQVNKSQNAIDSLKALSEPYVSVWRDGKKSKVHSEELVVGDVFIVDEGNLVPADATVIESHDFSVNESMLTGESLPLEKNMDEKSNKLLKGSLVSSGAATAIVIATGSATQFDKVAEKLVAIKVERSPLQKQIRHFVNGMIIFGATAFVAVWLYDFLKSGAILPGLLHGLTIAMSVFPEEVPVAFSTFMALRCVSSLSTKSYCGQPYDC